MRIFYEKTDFPTSKFVKNKNTFGHWELDSMLPVDEKVRAASPPFWGEKANFILRSNRPAEQLYPFKLQLPNFITHCPRVYSIPAQQTVA